MSFPAYLPNPPRVWSRVQSACTFQQDSRQIFNNEDKQMLDKGNILQYKKNSANLTKQQKYAQLARGGGPSRRKSYATQTQKYSNPNTNSFKRVNSIEIPFPNIIVGEPNNISGPYKFDVPNPYGCPGNNVETGGTLICNTIVNPCTKQIIQICPEKPNCFPITASDVPGFSNPSAIKNLCWDSNLQTWYPRQRYTMSNSGNKWPRNYKGLVSAYGTITPKCLNENFNNYLETLLTNINDFETGTGTGTETNSAPTTMFTKITDNTSFDKLFTYLQSVQLKINNGEIMNTEEFTKQYTELTNQIISSSMNLETQTEKEIITPNNSKIIKSTLPTNQKHIVNYNETPENSSNFNLARHIDETNTLQETVNIIASGVYSQSTELALGNLYTNVGKELLEFTNKYSLGLVDELQETFTYDVYQNLVGKIFNETFPLSNGFTNIREIVLDSLEGLYQTVLRNVSYKAEITKLNHIIEQLKNDNGGEIFDAKTTLGVIGEIRPEIIQYIQQYGFPEGGVFDTEKLGAILSNLN